MRVLAGDVRQKLTFPAADLKIQRAIVRLQKRIDGAEVKRDVAMSG